MVRKISEIYQEYKIMPGLQMHMFRVAAVASLICDNYIESLPKEEIVTVCLLHDMGNIIKSNFEFLPEFLKPEGLDYWQKVKDGYIEKYGKDTHKATIKIIKELNLSRRITSLADQNRFSLMCEHKNTYDIGLKIIHYTDARVSPHGVVSYDDRMEEAKLRYKRRDGITEDERDKLVACGKNMEKEIFAKCKIKPEDITEEIIQPIVSSLQNFVINTYL